MFNDKRAFIDPDVVMSIGFVVLAGMAIVATVIGYVLSKSWVGDSFKLWQLLIIIVVELIAAYFFAARG